MKIILFISVTISAGFLILKDINMKSEKQEIDFKTIQKEIEWFIERVKEESFEQGRHNVYAVKIYEGDHEGQYCVTMGYIDISHSIRQIENFKYYMYIQEDLIILDYSNDFKEKYELQNVNNIKSLTDKQIIANKINMEFEVIGIWGGYVCCYEKGNISKIFYENSEEIPLEKAIFKFFPPAPGTIIKIDSSSFEQMLKDKQKNPIK